MAEAGIDPGSITVLALTHTHQDHLNGLLTPDGRVLFPNLKAIVISEAAVESFRAEPHLAQFLPLLQPIRNGEHVAERLKAVALPGHAPGHTGYAFDTEEDHFLFFGDVVHVPALQFADPAFSWGFDDDQPTARATRLRVFKTPSRRGRGSPARTLAGRASGAWYAKEKHTVSSRLHNKRTNMRPASNQ